MEPIAAAVKPRRRYDATRRRQQAAHTRAEILAAARALFLERGYADTTIVAIAAAAGVSVETIYKSFGGKPGLVRAIVDASLAGVGPVPAWQRSDEMRLQETDPRQIIRNWGKLTAEVAPRGAPIVLLIRSAAASDPELAAVYEEVVDERLRRMEVNARHLFEHGYLRHGVTLDEARDVMWLYSSPEMYELLVVRQRWSLDRYSEFVASAMTAALL
jgi:AcrR family transcriptional regulator